MAGSDERIEITIEAVNNASSTIKKVEDDLKSIKAQAASTTSGFAGIGEAISKSLASVSTSVAKVTDELKKPLKSSMVVSTITEDPAYTKAKELLSKPLKSSMVVSTITEDPAYTKAKELLKKPLKSTMVITTVTDDAAFKNAAAASDKARIAAQTGYWNSYYKAQGVAATAAMRESAQAAKLAAVEANNAGGAFSSFGDLVTKAFSSYLVYQFLSTLKNATSAVLEWMGNMETYGIAIASSLQVGGNYVEITTGRVLAGAEAFNTAQRDAKGVIEALQVANFQTVATLDQLIRMYQEALPIAMKKGFDKKMVQDFTLSVTQAASAMGVSMDMMAEEARSLLTGAINMRNSRVAVALGITPEDVRENSASAGQLFSFLMGKLQVYRTAGEALQNSWRGLWSNLKDVMMQAGGKALEPLFEGIKTQLKEVVDSIVTLDKEAGKIIWNPAFLEGINTIKNGLVQVMNTFTALRNVMEGSVIGKILSVPFKVAGAAVDFVNDPNATITKYLGSYNPKTGGANLPQWLQDRSPENMDREMMESAIKSINAQKTITIREFGKTLEGGTEKEWVNIWVKKYAEQNKLDPTEIAGLLQKEGGGSYKFNYNPEGGGFGAVGYGQIRKPALDQLNKLGYKYELKDIMDPITNIKATTEYYKYLKDKFGSTEEAYKAFYGGEGFLTAHYSDKPMKDDQSRYAKAFDYSQGALKYQKDIIDKGDLKKPVNAELISKVEMTEIDKKDYQKIVAKWYTTAQQAYQKELDLEKVFTEQQKAEIETQHQSKEQNNADKAVAEELSARRIIEIKQEYLDRLKFLGENEVLLNEGKGVELTADDKTERARKLGHDLFKVDLDIQTDRIQLQTKITQEEQRQREADNAAALKVASEKVGMAQFEYDNLKKVNDLKVGLMQMTPTQAIDSETAARRNLLNAELNQLDVEDNLAKASGSAASSAQKRAKILAELANPERTRLEAIEKYIASQEQELKKTTDLTNAYMAYNEVVGVFNDELKVGLQIETLMTKAREADAQGLGKLATVYVATANAIRNLWSGPDFFVGFKTALRDMTNEIGSATKQWTELFKGVFDELKTGLSSGIYELFKGNLNFNKPGQLGNVEDRLKANAAQRERLELQLTEIDNNGALDASQKKIAKDAIDLQIKQLDAAKDLLQKQKDAVTNSKGIEDLWQGFLDALTRKIADFMASSIVIEFIAFLSGKSFGSSALGGLFGLGGGGGAGGESGVAGTVVDKGIGALWNYFFGGSAAAPLVAATYGAAPATAASTYGSLAMEGGIGAGAGASAGTGAGVYGSLAMEGIGTGGGAAGGAGAGGMANMAWLGPAAFAAGWLYTAYKIYQGIQDMASNNEVMAQQRIVGGINSLSTMSGEYAGQDVTKPESEGGGNLKMLGEGATDKEKMEFIQGYIQQMRDYGKEAKLTEEQISALITKAISPQNEAMRKAADLMNRISTTTTDMNGNIVTTTANMAAMKDILAGMNQATLEALPNLGSYGSLLRDMGINYDTFNSRTIDAALLTADLSTAFGLLDGGLTNVEVGPFTALLEVMKGAIEQNGLSILTLIPGLEKFREILAQIGIDIENLPTDKTITITTTFVEGENPNSGPLPEQWHKGGFVGSFHKGGFLKYHPWGGGIGADEVPIIAQRGEYVLSKKDVEFIDKVKGNSGGYNQVINMPAILPRINVIVNNQSGAGVQSAGVSRITNDEYIIDVLLKDIHANGRLRSALSFG